MKYGARIRAARAGRPGRSFATRGWAGMNRAPDRLCQVVVVVLCVRVICTLAENDVAGAPLQGSEESRVENRPRFRTVRTRIQPL